MRGASVSRLPEFIWRVTWESLHALLFQGRNEDDLVWVFQQRSTKPGSAPYRPICKPNTLNFCNRITCLFISYIRFLYCSNNNNRIMHMLLELSYPLIENCVGFSPPRLTPARQQSSNKMFGYIMTGRLILLGLRGAWTLAGRRCSK